MKKNRSIKKFSQETWIRFIWMTKKRFGNNGSVALWEEAKTKAAQGSLKYISWRKSLYSIIKFLSPFNHTGKVQKTCDGKKKKQEWGEGAPPLVQFFFLLLLRVTYASPAWRSIIHTSFLHFNPLSPNIHIQILQTDLHTFPWRISWENLVKDQIFFSLCSFINSHRLCSWQSMDIIRRKLILSTIGT